MTLRKAQIQSALMMVAISFDDWLYLSEENSSPREV